MREFIGGILATIQVHATSLTIALVVGIWLVAGLLMLEQVGR